MLAFDLRVRIPLIVSSTTALLLDGQGLSANIEVAGLAAEVTVRSLRVPALLFLEAN